MAVALPYIMAAATVASVGLQVKAGREQAKAMNMQAELRKQQARQEGIRAKQNGLNVLDNIARTNATIMARAGAGGVDALSGNPQKMMNLATANGITEYGIISDNATMAARIGLLDSQQMVSMGRSYLYGGLAAGTTTALQMGPKVAEAFK